MLCSRGTRCASIPTPDIILIMNTLSKTSAEVNQPNVLVLSAHADDHIACAGTLFKLKDKGYKLYEVVFTDSSEGKDYRQNLIDQTTDATQQMRATELSAASKFLGMEKTFQLNLEDLGLTYSKNLVFEVVKIIRLVKPTIGIIMNSFDFHPDHRETYKIGSEAFKFAGTGVKPELGENYRTPIVLCGEGMIPVAANILVDITNYASKKMELYKIYESQANPKALNFEQSLMNIRGYQLRKVNSLAAEAYTTDPLSPAILFED